MTKAKRILVVGYTNNPGGVESLILNLLTVIDRDTLQFDFLSNCGKLAFEDQLRAYGSRIYYITPRHESRVAFYRDLNDLFAAHANEWIAAWENMNSLANIDYLKYAKRYGIPCRIMHGHNSKNVEGTVRGILHQINRRRIRRYATHFWSVSDEASPWLYGKDFRSLPHYRVVDNVIDIDKFAYSQKARAIIRKELGVPDGAILLGNVGRLHEQKNQKLLIDLVGSCVASGMDAYAAIIGQGALLQELQDQAVTLGIGDRVLFPGVINNTAPYYSAMDAFVFPSLCEGLGIAFLEAQSNGLPCLISDGVARDGILNKNVVVTSLNITLDGWMSALRNLLAQGRTREIDLRGSRFDLSKASDLFSDLLGDMEK